MTMLEEMSYFYRQNKTSSLKKSKFPILKHKYNIWQINKVAQVLMHSIVWSPKKCKRLLSQTKVIIKIQNGWALIKLTQKDHFIEREKHK
jgi:hypothetical protein